MVEQSYLSCGGVQLKNLAHAAEAFADADIIDNYIMAAQSSAWAIAPQLGLLSTTRPVNILKARGACGRMNFPQQLGKIGKRNRTKASLVESFHHIAAKTTFQQTDH